MTPPEPNPRKHILHLRIRRRYIHIRVRQRRATHPHFLIGRQPTLDAMRARLLAMYAGRAGDERVVRRLVPVLVGDERIALGLADVDLGHPRVVQPVIEPVAAAASGDGNLRADAVVLAQPHEYGDGGDVRIALPEPSRALAGKHEVSVRSLLGYLYPSGDQYRLRRSGSQVSETYEHTTLPEAVEDTMRVGNTPHRGGLPRIEAEDAPIPVVIPHRTRRAQRWSPKPADHRLFLILAQVRMIVPLRRRHHLDSLMRIHLVHVGLRGTYVRVA